MHKHLGCTRRRVKVANNANGMKRLYRSFIFFYSLISISHENTTIATNYVLNAMHDTTSTMTILKKELKQLVHDEIHMYIEIIIPDL